jgi:UDP-glucose 4-epimerase
VRILVTGGAGFIGSHIVDAYIEAGHEVAAIDDLSSGKRENLNSRARFYHLDICDGDLEEVFRDFRPEVVNHHAAQLSVSLSVREPEQDARINVLGTVRLMECAARNGVQKALFASSAGVYGVSRLFPVEEASSLSGISPYGVSKISGEFYFKYYAAQHGIPCTIFRYSNVYGPRQNAHGEAGVVAIFRDAMQSGRDPVIFGAEQPGDGGCHRDYVYVGDIASANVLALFSGDGEVLNIGTGVETSTLSLFKIMATELGFSGTPDHRDPRVGDLLRSVLDVNRATKVLGWRPETSIGAGLARTIAAFESATTNSA